MPPPLLYNHIVFTIEWKKSTKPIYTLAQIYNFDFSFNQSALQSQLPLVFQIGAVRGADSNRARSISKRRQFEIVYNWNVIVLDGNELFFKKIVSYWELTCSYLERKRFFGIFVSFPKNSINFIFNGKTVLYNEWLRIIGQRIVWFVFSNEPITIVYWKKACTIAIGKSTLGLSILNFDI